MKRLVEDFDDMMNIEDEVSVEDTKSPLEKELIRVYEYLKDKGETDIKAYEVAYQEAIENIYPENSWWEVIDLNIFWDLFENQNPRTTIDNIISSIKPEFKKEVIDTVVTEDIEEENPLKDIRSNIIEFPNGEYAYVEYADGKLYAGSATNRGIIHEYEMDYDKDYDVDRNLQDFFDKIIEENPELGEPLDESKKVCEDTIKQDNKWVNKGKDGTHGTFRTKKAADAQRRAMFANKDKKSTFGESRKLRSIKEDNDDFVIFEQEPYDFIDTEWYFDYDGIDYYIDGGRDFADINKDFLNEDVDNEAIHKAFDDIDDDHEFYTVEDVFDYFDDGDIVDALSAGLGEEYGSAVLRGYSQGEWATIYYPKREYSREDIQEIEDYYFGKVTAWYNDDYGRAVIADTELGSHYNDSAKIKELISDYTGAPVDKIKLRRFNGYHQVADYIDESKQRRRSNRCVTEAKKEKLDKSAKQNVKVFKGLFDGLVHWNNNFSAYAPMDEPTLKQRIQKLFKKVDSMISDAATFANRFKVVYRSLLAAGVSLDKSPSTIKRLADNLSQKYKKLAEQYKDDRSDRYENGKLAELYFAYASAFEDLSDFVDEVNAEINKDIKESLSKKTKAKRIYESMKRKPKKNLKEAADDEIKLFMNTWANYNENGADDGITPTGWMSLDEAEEYAEKYAEYEPFINDTDNVPKELGVNEYSNISETIDMLHKYEDFDDTQREVFAAFIDDGYDVDEALDTVDDEDYFYIEGDSDTDLAYNYIDETGGIEELGRDTLEQYFDYDAFGRDLAYDFIKTEHGYVSH